VVARAQGGRPAPRPLPGLACCAALELSGSPATREVAITRWRRSRSVAPAEVRRASRGT
jgi:hypothetical protein